MNVSPRFSGSLIMMGPHESYKALPTQAVRDHMDRLPAHIGGLSETAGPTIESFVQPDGDRVMFLSSSNPKNEDVMQQMAEAAAKNGIQAFYSPETYKHHSLKARAQFLSTLQIFSPAKNEAPVEEAAPVAEASTETSVERQPLL